jgi:hypothetical protein
MQKSDGDDLENRPSHDEFLSSSAESQEYIGEEYHLPGKS